MAILLEFINVIIPIKNIERCQSIGGFAGLLEKETEAIGRRVWHDDYLYRDGAMNPEDAKDIVQFWEAQGLTTHAAVDGAPQWIDICVVDYFGGPTLPCSWLEHDSTSYSVWLSGTPPGKVIGPFRRDK